MGSASSNDKQNLSKAQVYEFKNPTTFVNPNLCEQFPILEKYCASETIFTRYDCKNLQRILFVAANSQYRGDEIFDYMARSVGTEDQDKIYHINCLMQFKEEPATIYNTINDFKQKCHELESKNNAVASVSLNETT
jgi:hypothetical protein